MSLFASFVVYLKPQVETRLTPGVGRLLHAVFLNLIGEQDPALSASLHADAQVKPFTVSPLRGRFRRARTNQDDSSSADARTDQSAPAALRVSPTFVAIPGATYWVRYTTLSEPVFRAASRVLLGKFLHRRTITLNGVEFVVTDVAVEPQEDNQWGRMQSAEEIWSGASTASEITLRFVSPTTFKQRGLNLLFPLPLNVFHSYRDRWNAFTSFQIDDGFLAWVEQNVAVEAHHLQTRPLDFGEVQLRGFTGWVRYGAVDKDLTRIKQLNALADFAFFCGTGQKTTQGMGQTRRIVG